MLSNPFVLASGGNIAETSTARPSRSRIELRYSVPIEAMEVWRPGKRVLGGSLIDPTLERGGEVSQSGGFGPVGARRGHQAHP